MSMLATFSVTVAWDELAPSGGCRTGPGWTGWRGGGQSVAAAASSAMAVRADDSSAMVLPAVQAASSAVVARRLMARGMPRAQEWMTRTASSEKRVSLRPAWARWARRYPSASAAVIAGEGMTHLSCTLWSRAAMSPTRRRLLRVGWPMSRTVSGERGLDLGDEVGGVEAGGLAERGGQGAVDAPDADLGVGQVDEGVAGRVEAVGGGAERGGFPGADFSCQDADAAGGDQPAQAGDGFLVGGGGEQRRGGDGGGERHAGEAVVGLQVRDHDGPFRQGFS